MRFDLCRVGPFLSRNVLSQRVASLFTFFHVLFCSSWADLELNLNSSCALIFRLRCHIESVWSLAHIHARAKAPPPRRWYMRSTRYGCIFQVRSCQRIHPCIPSALIAITHHILLCTIITQLPAHLSSTNQRSRAKLKYLC